MRAASPSPTWRAATRIFSAAYPRLIDHYRSACAIAEREHLGQATTEELRQALVHYRELFQALFEDEPIGRAA